MIFLLTLQVKVPAVLFKGRNTDYSCMQFIGEWIKETLPDTLVFNADVGNGIPNTRNWNIDKQAKELQVILKKQPELKNGFIGIGASQGGYVLRHYLQMYNDPPMLRFVSQAGPLAGFFSTDNCFNGECEIMRKSGYTKETQEQYALAGWWRDPRIMKEFSEGSESLAKLDNLRDFDEKRKQNFVSLDRLILLGDKSDNIINPWQSSFFGFYADNDSTLKVVDMKDRREYKEDLFGLKTLVEANKVVMYHTKMHHSDYIQNSTSYKKYFNENIIQHFNMDI